MSEEEIEKEAKATFLKKDVTLDIINQADQAATRVEIWKINEDDKTAWARLYDADDNLIVSNRVYSYEGEYKDIPCELTDTDIVLLKADTAIARSQEFLDSVQKDHQ